jgi:hypothetical protein
MFIFHELRDAAVGAQTRWFRSTASDRCLPTRPRSPRTATPTALEQRAFDLLEVSHRL